MTQHIIVDCLTGDEHQLTHEEAIAHPAVAIDENHEQWQGENVASQQAEEKQRQKDLAVLRTRAKEDPVFDVLLRRMGL